MLFYITVKYYNGNISYFVYYYLVIIIIMLLSLIYNIFGQALQKSNKKKMSPPKSCSPCSSDT